MRFTQRPGMSRSAGTAYFIAAIGFADTLRIAPGYALRAYAGHEPFRRTGSFFGAARIGSADSAAARAVCPKRRTRRPGIGRATKKDNQPAPLCRCRNTAPKICHLFQTPSLN